MTIAIFSGVDQFPLYLPSGVTIGTPVLAADGRAAIAHGFGAADLALLRSLPGVEVREELPTDWAWPAEE